MLESYWSEGQNISLTDRVLETLAKQGADLQVQYSIFLISAVILDFASFFLSRLQYERKHQPHNTNAY